MSSHVWQSNKDILIVPRFIVSSKVKSSLTNPEEPDISPDEGKHCLPARTTNKDRRPQSGALVVIPTDMAAAELSQHGRWEGREMAAAVSLTHCGVLSVSHVESNKTHTHAVYACDITL